MRTDEDPHELVFRLRAGAGDPDFLAEVLSELRDQLRTEGVSSKFRKAKNSDGSLDGELRVQTEGDFEAALLALGEVANLPREV